MISCEKAVTICHKSQYKEAALPERVRLALHLLFCKRCAGFSKRNRHLSQLCEQAKFHQLSELEKDRIRQRLEEGLRQ